ncbi:aromatic prenyltransferase [Penicillium malachiteum]|uniref:Aromatic prenyltransferase n=1 Tax=Penicillium malachiteum TaxID=1324776 RepID=A0AAD6MQX0_9EURO|nr:aromatic prenyltransferase [Penicillium malachiteum]
MGSKPSSSRPCWRSFMTDDHTPIEYSWKWKSGGRAPEIRYSIEPISIQGDSYRTDPMNQSPTVDLLHNLSHSIPSLDMTWFNDFQQSPLGPGTPASTHPEAGRSSVFLAFEMVHGRIGVKAYFLPVETPSQTAAQQIFDAIRMAGCSNIEAVHSLEEYLLEAKNQGHSIKPFMVGIDCIDPGQSRLKIYARAQETSYSFVRNAMTLGGRRKGLDGVIGELNELWKSTLGLAPDEPQERPLPKSSHHTSGTLFYFDVAPKSPLPDVKTYIPVRHYAESDLTSALSLLNFIEKRNISDHTQACMRCLQELATPDGLGSTTGVQTYITVAFEGDNLSITSHLNPQIYDLSRWSA